jgi:hypothetical protein
MAVSDNLPQVIPVTTAEVEALENFLGPLLDQLLADSDAYQGLQQAGVAKGP